MNCKIVGYEYKTLEVTLSPGESSYAERGRTSMLKLLNNKKIRL